MESSAQPLSARSSERLRVARVYRTFARSGSIASLFVRDIERLSHDVDVTAVCSTKRRVQTSAPVRFLDVEPVLTGSGRISYAVECATFARRATRALQNASPSFDVVHAEGFACLWADVVTAHAVRSAEVEHYFENVEPAAGLRKRLSPLLFRPQVRVAAGIEKTLYRSPAPLVICPSQRVKDDLARWHDIPAELVEVIPYGIDIAAFRHDGAARSRIRRQEGTADETTVILSVGDEFERKGVARLIEALGRSSARAELWVIGGDDPGRYVEQARSTGVADRVRFLGRKPFEELPAWYAACDVLAVISRQDSWAIPVIEGMAAGRAVLASEYTGSNEAITNGRTGYVVSRDGDPGEIASLLDGPLADPATRAAIGAHAAADAHRFDAEVAYAELLDVYERAALRRTRRPVPLRVRQQPAGHALPNTSAAPSAAL